MPKSEREQLRGLGETTTSDTDDTAHPMLVVVTWENTGHGINVQRPARFNALLERVWNEGRL